MTLLEWLTDISVFFLTAGLGVFSFRYGTKAPWYKSFEGRVLFLTYFFFFIIMMNLSIFILTGYGAYGWTRVITMAVGGVMVVYQNILLTRARRLQRSRP